ncbi:1-acyl-sn-glycerol-3-phosphate acyltransferase [Pseudohongiella sp.]|uniref:Phospholipid/glycerol acyltransferase domain-containing protein n=1 Tax=marine sediment metagenome TaxID=412755 RepID=A0A0F9W0E4_9ZZZZ|nr:1-acyl-sn-glycerol-3-phosphate acyltransferase [Pseudohongiella sp.]HDZ08431.1 1-acyl-sn-glycerol-3-phosphate acyltransferase [Pseudohongiella sp.]HEA62796.1 1-acyl-sn-glycerol-3-phosphate acyltransferase [Pseudohongiella sp.]
MDPFKDIRPYHDEEIRPVLDALLKDRDFIRSIASFSHPTWYRWVPSLLAALTQRRLTAQLKDVDSVKSMQDVIAGYMDQMIERTTSRLTNSGLEKLSHDKSYLFISNHRDIAMDPAFVNYMLYHAGFDTLYIAIGDNLLKRPFVTDLMRLNKSFIVKRSLKGRELLKSSKQLSEYIHHCIEINRNVWIAQREGRAKDGVDRTDTALLKMLGMARRPAALGDALQALHIVPVSISYEYDPCDALKGDELHQKLETGSYQKDEQSDINSIVTGMVGFKGHVHVAFGDELTLDADMDDEAIAAQIDGQVINNYLLQQTNLLALQQLQHESPESVPPLSGEGSQVLAELQVDPATAEKFNARLSSMSPGARHHVRLMYANPVISRFADRR